MSKKEQSIWQKVFRHAHAWSYGADTIMPLLSRSLLYFSPTLELPSKAIHRREALSTHLVWFYNTNPDNVGMPIDYHEYTDLKISR